VTITRHRNILMLRLPPRPQADIYVHMDDEKRKLYRMLAVLSTAGMVIVFATVIGVYIGFKLDQWLSTTPWFTIIFFMFGLIAGFKNLYTYAKRSMERFDDKKDKKQ